MVYEKILCPYCKSDKVVRYGKNNTGKQRMMCQNPECSHKTFQLEYSNNASKPETKEKIIGMAMNGSGTRDTGRVLKISPISIHDIHSHVNKSTRLFYNGESVHNLTLSPVPTASNSARTGDFLI